MPMVLLPKINVSKKKIWGFGYVKSTGWFGDTASGRGHVNHEKVKPILHERFCLSELTWPFTQWAFIKTDF